VRLALATLDVHPDRMRDNLDLTRGLLMAESLSMALARQLGKQEAHHVVQEASQRAVREGADLATVARADRRISGALSPGELAAALDPASYLGSTDLFVDRAVAAFRAMADSSAGLSGRSDRGAMAGSAPASASGTTSETAGSSAS
jgi:3-carboxy-cis,cis-muconate cycloisomerase